MNYQLMSFRNAIQIHLLCSCLSQSSFHESSDKKNLGFFWKSITLFSKTFLLCYVFYFVYCFICALNGINEAGHWTCWPFACRKIVLSLRMLGKNEIFEIQTCLESETHLLFRLKYLQLHTKNPKLQAQKPATTGNSTRNFRQSAIRPRVSSHAHCR